MRLFKNWLTVQPSTWWLPTFVLLSFFATNSFAQIDITPPILNGIPVDTAINCNSLPAPVGPLPVHYWPFDEISGTIATDVIAGDVGVLSSSGVALAPGSGQLFGAADFDGVSGAIIPGNIDLSGSQLTISAWVKVTALTGKQGRVISKATATPTTSHFWLLGMVDTTAIRFRLRTTSGSTLELVSSVGELTLNNWHFIAAVYDGSEMRIYNNGLLVASRIQTGTIDEDPAVGVGIGNQPTVAGSRPFPGLIDELKLYEVALSDTEINALYAEGLAAVSATDDFDPAPIISFTESAGSGCPYTITRTWTATDATGNSGSTSQLITVIDTVAPILAAVPADFSVNCLSEIPAPDSTVTATDQCDLEVTISSTDNSTATGIERIWTATDDCGNSSSASQNISVNNLTNPSFFGVPADSSLDCSLDAPSVATTVFGLSSTGDTLTVSFTEDTAGFCPKTITRTWTTTDVCGNSNSASQILSFTDTTAPILSTFPSGGVVTCGDSIPAAPFLTATDDCDTGVTVTFTETLFGFDSIGDCDYTIFRGWSATDSCGNSSMHSQLIQIIAPVLVPPTALDDMEIGCFGSTISVNVLANDSDSDGFIDTASLAINSAVTGGIAIVNLDGSIGFAHDGLTDGPFLISYSIADNDALTATAMLTINLFPNADVSISQTAENCGAMDGQIDLTLSGGSPPFSFLWSNGATTEDLSGLAAGTYTVSITDANSCAFAESISIAANNNLALEAVTTFPASTCTSSDGSVLIDLENTMAGTPPYLLTINGSYNFGPFASEPFVLVGIPGRAQINNLLISDADGCELFDQNTYQIGKPSPPAIESISIVNPVCGIDTTGSLVIDLVDSLAGGPNYFVKLSNQIYGPFNAEPITLANLPSGDYQKPKVRSGNGCIFKGSGVYSIAYCPAIRLDAAQSSSIVGAEGSFLHKNFWPNPTSGPMNISLELEAPLLLQIEVLNIHQQVVYSASFDQVQQLTEQLDFSSLATGAYSIKWTVNAEQVYYDQLIIQR